MTNTVLGLGKVFSNTTQTVAANSVSSTKSRTYGVQKNSSGQLVVNVPWSDKTQLIQPVQMFKSADPMLYQQRIQTIQPELI